MKLFVFLLSLFAKLSSTFNTTESEHLVIRPLTFRISNHRIIKSMLHQLQYQSGTINEYLDAWIHHYKRSLYSEFSSQDKSKINSMIMLRQFLSLKYHRQASNESKNNRMAKNLSIHEKEPIQENHGYLKALSEEVFSFSHQHQGAPKKHLSLTLWDGINGGADLWNSYYSNNSYCPTWQDEPKSYKYCLFQRFGRFVVLDYTWKICYHGPYFYILENLIIPSYDDSDDDYLVGYSYNSTLYDHNPTLNIMKNSQVLLLMWSTDWLSIGKNSPALKQFFNSDDTLNATKLLKHFSFLYPHHFLNHDIITREHHLIPHKYFTGVKLIQ